MVGLEMDDDVEDAEAGVGQCVLDGVGDDVALVDGDAAVDPDVDVDVEVRAGLADAVFLDADDAGDLAGDLDDLPRLLLSAPPSTLPESAKLLLTNASRARG